MNRLGRKEKEAVCAGATGFVVRRTPPTPNGMLEDLPPVRADVKGVNADPARKLSGLGGQIAASKVWALSAPCLTQPRSASVIQFWLLV